MTKPAGPKRDAGAMDEPGPAGPPGPKGERGEPGIGKPRVEADRATIMETGRIPMPGHTVREAARTTVEIGRSMETHRTPDGDPRRTGPRRPAHDDDPRLGIERDDTHRRNGSAGLGWLWVLPLAALAGLGWYLLRGTPTERNDVTAGRETVQQSTTTTAATTAGSELQRQAGSVFQTLTAAMQGIKDQDTATAALPRIQAAAEDVDKLAVQSVQLPIEARKALASSTRDEMGKLNTLIDSTSSLPGVGPILQPAIASLRGGMDAIAMVPGKPLFFASAPSPDWVPLSSVLDREVVDRAGNGMGTASGFYLASDGRIVASLLSVDRQLGIGEKQVATPFAAGQLVRKDDGWRLVIDTSKDELQRAKAFEK
jgi:hypothetical protein